MRAVMVGASSNVLGLYVGRNKCFVEEVGALGEGGEEVTLQQGKGFNAKAGKRVL